MSLNPFQISFAGLTMGDGTPYDILDIDGLDTLPAINKTDVDKARDWGQFLGQYYSSGREVVANIEVTGTSDANFRANLDALGAATAPQATTEQPLAFLLPGMTQVSRQINARVAARANLTDILHVHDRSKVAVKWWATDPRIYDSTSTTVAIAAATTVVIANAGTFGSRPVVTISGPAGNPEIDNLTSGKNILFSGLTLASGDVLVVDLLHQTAILNGTSSVRGYMTSTSAWWELAPGNNSIRYVPGAGSASLVYQSAWI